MWRRAGSTVLRQLHAAGAELASATGRSTPLCTGAPTQTRWQEVVREAAATLNGGVAAPGARRDAVLQPASAPATKQQQRQRAGGLGGAEAAADLAAPSQGGQVAEPALDAAAEQQQQPLPNAKKRHLRRKVQRHATAAAAPQPADDSLAAGSSASGGGGRAGRRAARRAAGEATLEAEAQPQRAEHALPTEAQPAAGGALDAQGRQEAPERHGTEAAAGTAAAAAAAGPACPLPPPLVLQDDAHPIRDSDLPRTAWSVLSRLRAAGHEAYVVGGTLRDLLLGGTPKDADLLTSAEPHQIKRLFARCLVVGRSFPVCQVVLDGAMVEVSSFSTGTDPGRVPADAALHLMGRRKAGRRESGPSPTWAGARADNAARRDFTVNGLLYEPFGRLLFDSVGGVADCRARLLRTICPPGESFRADPARILRGVRLAARAGLELDGGTAAAMEELATAVGQLPQGRLQMELASLLGYGAAAPSLALMWRLGLLDLLLPQHALHLKRRRVPRAPRGTAAASPGAGLPGAGRKRGPPLLFELVAELDRHVSPQRPVDPAVWVALLAAPLVAERCEQLTARGLRRVERRQRDSRPPWQQQEEQQREKATQGASATEPAACSEQQEGSDSGDGDETGGGALSAAIRQQAAHLRYVERYSSVVSEVLDAMQQPLDAATLAELGRQSKKRGSQLAAARGVKQREAGALLPCVLSKASLERAGALLLLEAELRGHPELQPLLGRRAHAEPPPAAAGAGAGAGRAEEPREEPSGAQEAAEQGHGRHGEHHQLWQRLERAMGGAEGGGGGGARRRRGAGGGRLPPGRRLSPEERLVLGILSDPAFGFAALTALPP